MIPVTLTVAPSTTPFFDNVQGQMGFFGAVTNPATTPASQTMQIRNFGTGQLNWTVTPVTADSGNWLTLSSTSGTAPSNITVRINPQNLPNPGLIAGEFTGQLLFQSSGSTVTVPVSVQLGSNICTQMAGLNFSMPYGGSNPTTQSLNRPVPARPSTVRPAMLPAMVATGYPSHRPVTFVANSREYYFQREWRARSPATPVPAGIHTGQAVFIAAHSAMTVPVTLTVSGTPKWSIAKTHTGNFVAGQNNATYTVTVSNQIGASVGPTSGTATVTETVPTGMTLVSMAGKNWTCGPGGNTCTRSDSLTPDRVMTLSR